MRINANTKLLNEIKEIKGVIMKYFMFIENSKKS
jgi:hypothetical protein